MSTPVWVPGTVTHADLLRDRLRSLTAELEKHINEHTVADGELLARYLKTSFRLTEITL